jgi:hypothetical protein
LNIENERTAFENFFVFCDMEKSKNKKQKASLGDAMNGLKEVGLPQGRPSKMRTFTQALYTLFKVPDKRIAVDDGGEDIGLNFRVIAMTDEGLVSCVNDMVDEKDRITLRTFERYKRGEIGANDPDGENVSLFLSAYKRAIDQQRFALARALADDVPGGWQRYAWLLERKFDDFNLRSKSVDETPDVKRLVLKVGE